MNFFFQDSLMNKKLKRAAFIEILCNIINVFTVTFDQFNASLPSKSIKPLEWWFTYTTFNSSVSGQMLSDVLQHLHRGDGVCGLVLTGVHAALHPGPQQAGLPPAAAQPDRHHSHPALLHHAGGGQHLHGREALGLGQQLPGQSGPSAARAAGVTHPLRDAAGAPLARTPDARADGTPVHAGVRPAPPLPLRGHSALLAAPLPDRERGRGHARVQ